MLQPGRQFTAANSTGYRFGMNSQEKSIEVEGSGNQHRRNSLKVGRFLFDSNQYLIFLRKT